MTNLRWFWLSIFLGGITLSDLRAEETPLPGDRVEVRVTPVASGLQLVRTSLPLPEGMLREGQGLAASDGQREMETGVRVLTWHPAKGPRSARRALVTFPYRFTGEGAVRFTLRAAPAPAEASPRLPVEVKLDGEALTVVYRDGPTLKARLMAPARTAPGETRTEVVESNAHFLWQRIHLPDSEWPRIVEVRADVLGGLVVVAHLQRNLEGDGRAPDFGWEVAVEGGRLVTEGAGRDVLSHGFADGKPCDFLFEGYRLYHPAAPLKRRGKAEIQQDAGKTLYRYWRCTAEERVPMQQAAWQRAELAIAPAGLARLTAMLESPHEVRVDGGLWEALYGFEAATDLGDAPALGALSRYHRDAVVRSVAAGDDWGNVTGYADGQETGGAFGMNRLNHCPSMFEEGYRSGDRRLVEAGLLWCDNVFDQSIWWGPDKTGGTRYNNVIAMGRTPPDDDRSYMWRSNSAVHFCTKGYDSFLLAYEETGDPRMREALEAQVRYAAEQVHTDRGECRNVGDVRDFVRLYRYTGEARYLDEALRLFRELRTKLSTGDLFDQGGKPLDPDPPFIEEDDGGLKVGYAKPYIIGYALVGLPELAVYAPEEPKLRDVVRAVADFLADSQDPIGGWRYPHPRSSQIIMNQAMEHAWQIVQADRLLGPQERHLDAVERVLRQRILGWQRTGKVFGGVNGWEVATGKVKDGKELYGFYQKPGDRGFARDYAEGEPGFGYSSPEGLVYFWDVLAFYLKHRPASRLLAPPKDDEPLGKVLARVRGKP